MATESEDLQSIESRLTKGDVAPTKAKDNEDFSALTGYTRESKAKAYAAAKTKKVSLQYVDTINDLNGKHKVTVWRLQAQLEEALHLLEVNKASTNGDKK